MENKKLSELTPNPKNPRKAKDTKLATLKRSLIEMGSLDGFVQNRRSGNLVSGHQRQKQFPDATITIEKKYKKPTAAGTVEEGFVEIEGERFPFRLVDWDEAKEKAAMVAANRNAGDWDFSALKEIMIDLDSLNFDMDLTGFDVEERENLIVPIERIPPAGDPDHVPAPPKDPITKPGDLWKLGDHYLLCGDSTMIDEIEKLMAGGKADMLFTDPPYGVDYEGGHNQKKREGIAGDALEGSDIGDLFYNSILNALTVLADHAALYIWYASGKSVETYKGIGQLPIKIRAVIAWYKVKSGLGAFMAQYIPNYEPMIYAHKQGCSPQWFGPTDEKTVWELKRDGKNEFHPTQKPVELVERAIRNSSVPGDIVLDLFGGSGSTLIACEKTTRKARLIEMAPTYCDVIVRRWEEYTGQKAELVTQ